MDDAAQVSCNKHSDFWSSHPSGAIFHFSNLSQLHEFKKVEDGGQILTSRGYTQKYCISAGEEVLETCSVSEQNVQKETAERN